MKLADFGLAIEVARGEKGWYGESAWLLCLYEYWTLRWCILVATCP